jgi:hypothetical protein
MRDADIIETELMEISAMADDGGFSMPSLRSKRPKPAATLSAAMPARPAAAVAAAVGLAATRWQSNRRRARRLEAWVIGCVHALVLSTVAMDSVC